MKKILVTGSNGYLGSSFIKKYPSKYGFEKFSLLNEKIECIKFDDINTVLHCAALVHQKRDYPYEKYHEINVDYPVKLALMAKKHGVKQFVFLSTIAVYGEDKERLNENTKCNPITPYGKSKLKAEIELKKLEDDNFKVSIIRPPIVYGYKAPGNMRSLVNLVKKVPILPFGDIQNRRSMVYVGNLCHLIDEVIGQEEDGIFLAGDDVTVSTTRLIELIAKNLDKKVLLVRIPFFESFLKIAKPSFHKRLFCSLEVDISETKEKLGLSNPYSLEEGIKYMIKGEDL